MQGQHSETALALQPDRHKLAEDIFGRKDGHMLNAVTLLSVFQVRGRGWGDEVRRTGWQTCANVCTMV